METQLANQIARALVLDGVCKLTQDQIVEALRPVYVDGFRFGGVARERTSPGKVSRLTIFATAADGVYRAFSGHSVLYDQIVLFASEDGARWTKWIVYDGGRGAVDYPTNPLAVPLTFTAEEAAVLSFRCSGTQLQVEVSIDEGKTWEAKTGTSGGTVLADLQPGEKVLVRGNNASYPSAKFLATGKMAASGNIMSLTVSQNFEAVTTVAERAFEYFFEDCDWLTAAPLLPATTLATRCYFHMFQGCLSLTKAPDLPATTLAPNCYEAMFSGCTSLTDAPDLPATTLAGSCYSAMFSGCSSLTAAPELPATTLAGTCYSFMFRNCRSLEDAPELPATTLAGGCYREMFSSCESLTKGPVLPATTLEQNCYAQMFYYCSRLASVVCLATNISANNALSSWLDGVAAAGTFRKASGVTFPSGASGIPAGWTVEEV